MHISATVLSILADIRNIRLIKETFTALHLTPKAMVYDGYGLAHSLLSDEERKDRSIIVDLGKQSSKCHVIQNDELIYSKHIPIGQDHVDSDIATCLHVSKSDAIRLKQQSGTLNVASIDASETISVNPIKQSPDVNRRILCQIIEARIYEICKLLKDNPTLFVAAPALHHWQW